MPTADRYRRSPGVVIYWAGDQAICFTPQSPQRVPLSLEAIGVLQRLTDWTAAGDLRDRIAPGADVSLITETIGLLHSLGLVEREGDVSPDEHWQAWSPEATLFHFGTKNQAFVEDLTARDRALVEKAKHDPPPPPTKRIDGARLRLPELDLRTSGPSAFAKAPADKQDLKTSDLQHALKTRRTWRRFSDQPVPAGALGTLLNLTFGVQARGSVDGQGPIVLRTSPSGGSRHPIEAYVLAWNVEGLTPGAYHYDSDAMELVDLQHPIAATDIAPLLAHQTYFAGAGAVVVMCAVFARTMWRYGHSRAYRTVLIDAGHLGQTFCLAATALGLAPFTTMAFNEAGLEDLLRIDGVGECPMYVAGVGMPDPAAAGAPGRYVAELEAQPRYE